MIENYDKAINDKETVWVIHHRLETHDENGNLRNEFISAIELIRMDLYYNRPAAEFIFMPRSEHSSLHSKWYSKGRTVPEETRIKISNTLKGNIPWNKGRKGCYSEEIRKKMSEAHKDYSEETRKKMSEAHKGQRSWAKGRKFSEEHKRKLSEAHKGIRPSEGTRKKLSESHKGRIPWNKGKHRKFVDGKYVYLATNSNIGDE